MKYDIRKELCGTIGFGCGCVDCPAREGGLEVGKSCREMKDAHIAGALAICRVDKFMATAKRLGVCVQIR